MNPVYFSTMNGLTYNIITDNRQNKFMTILYNIRNILPS